MISQGNVERRLQLKPNINEPFLQHIFKIKTSESHCFLIFICIRLVSSSLEEFTSLHLSSSDRKQYVCEDWLLQ